MHYKYPYKIFKSACNNIEEKEYSQLVYERYSKITDYKKLKAQNCAESIIFTVLQIKRSTFFRWKRAYEQEGLAGLEDYSKAPNKRPRKKHSKELVQLVLKIRKENPTWGKKKIFVILKRDFGVATSISTVGRIIEKLIKSGKVRPAWFYYGRLKQKKRRVFNHAQRWKYGMQAQDPGELIQVDHTEIEVEPDRYIKQFDATCPITKITVSEAYSRATSTTAAKFLELMQEQFPFQIKSIQVDGGSEFMGDFEMACKAKNILLYVLPPRSPEFNGNVERRHGTIKYEFFATYDGSAELAEIRPKLAQFMLKYNTYRPHEALDFETPWSFYLKLEA